MHGRDHRDASRRVEPARGAPRTAPGRRERRPWRAALGSSPASPHDRRPGKAADDRPANRSRSSARGGGPVSARGPNRLRPRNRLGVTRTAPRAERGFKCAGSRKGRWACMCVRAEAEAQSGAPFKPCKTVSASSRTSPNPSARPSESDRRCVSEGPVQVCPDGPTGLPADPSPGPALSARRDNAARKGPRNLKRPCGHNRQPARALKIAREGTRNLALLNPIRVSKSRHSAQGIGALQGTLPRGRAAAFDPVQQRRAVRRRPVAGNRPGRARPRIRCARPGRPGPGAGTAADSPGSEVQSSAFLPWPSSLLLKSFIK